MITNEHLHSYDMTGKSASLYESSLSPEYRSLLNSPNLPQIAKQSKTILSNGPFMKLLVAKQGLALRYASEEIKDDRFIVLAAIRNNQQAFDYASDRLKNDKAFLLALFPYTPAIFHRLNNELKNDKEFVLSAINVNTKIIRCVRDNLKRDLDVLKLVLEKDPTMARAFSKSMRQEIGKNDPVDYVNKLSLKKNLEKDLEENVVIKTRNKI